MGHGTWDEAEAAACVDGLWMDISAAAAGLSFGFGLVWFGFFSALLFLFLLFLLFLLVLSLSLASPTNHPLRTRIATYC